MAARGTTAACKVVRPMLSFDNCEAHTRVLGLYRALYREIPVIEKYFDMPKDQKQIKAMIRSYFYYNAHLEDVRVIDLLVIKGWMDFKEIRNNWIQKGCLYSHFCPTIEPKPQTFVEKFLQSNDL